MQFFCRFVGFSNIILTNNARNAIKIHGMGMHTDTKNYELQKW